jgi:hypothetical protein
MPPCRSAASPAARMRTLTPVSLLRRAATPPALGLARCVPKTFCSPPPAPHNPRPRSTPPHLPCPARLSRPRRPAHRTPPGPEHVKRRRGGGEGCAAGREAAWCVGCPPHGDVTRGGKEMPRRLTLAAAPPPPPAPRRRAEMRAVQVTRERGGARAGGGSEEGWRKFASPPHLCISLPPGCSNIMGPKEGASSLAYRSDGKGLAPGWEVFGGRVLQFRKSRAAIFFRARAGRGRCGTR